jgi:hypothetical protein
VNGPLALSWREQYREGARMAEETWFVAMDGQQLEGARGTEDVRSLIRANPSKKIVVWNEKMTGWADPATVPAFRAMAAPSETPPPPAPSAAPPPRPSPNPVAAAVAASAPEARATLHREVHFFRGLLDFKFEEYVTPKIIRTLYILSLVLVAIGWLVMIVSGIGMIAAGSRYGGMTALIGILYLVLSPLFAIIQLTLIRVFFELVLVFFSIKESIASLDEKTARGAR